MDANKRQSSQMCLNKGFQRLANIGIVKSVFPFMFPFSISLMKNQTKSQSIISSRFTEELSTLEKQIGSLDLEVAK